MKMCFIAKCRLKVLPPQSIAQAYAPKCFASFIPNTPKTPEKIELQLEAFQLIRHRNAALATAWANGREPRAPS